MTKKKETLRSKLPLAFLAEEAFKKGVAKAIADHKRTGDPIAIWQDGKVVKVPANQIEVREAQADYSKVNKAEKSN